MTTVLTVTLDAASQARFNALREAHYPAALNRIAAHVTLFHTLPADEAIHGVLLDFARRTAGFGVRVSGVMSLGRGVAYALESSALMAVRRELAAEFSGLLSAQDRQGFRPHVVVQNKVSGEVARELRTKLEAEFEPWECAAVGLSWWDYLGGPWALRERFIFAE